MKVRIPIDKRLYDDMVQFCNANGKEVEVYCTSALRKQLSLDKYGDLNEKIIPKEEKKKPTIIKKVEENKVNVQVIEPKPIAPHKTEIKSETKVEVPNEVPEIIEESKKTTKHRTIKTK